MQIMMMMHNTHTSWDGKPMATMGWRSWWQSAVGDHGTTRPQDADTGKKNRPQSRRVTPDHAYRTKIHIYVSLAKVESNISCSNTEIWVQFKNIDHILQSWLLNNLPLRSLPKGDENQNQYCKFNRKMEKCQ
jgi:hypothetical protein